MTLIASTLLAAFIATPAHAEPSTWMVSDMSSTATGEVTVFANLSSSAWDGDAQHFNLAMLEDETVRSNQTDWWTDLGSTFTSMLYFTVATTPAPAQDVTVTFEDGTSTTVYLPDTSDLEHGAVFLVDFDDGTTYWTDEDHDGNGVDDALWYTEARSPTEHLARQEDGGAGEVVVEAEDDGRAEETLVEVATGAFELSPPGGFGDADGGTMDDDELLQLQHNLLELEVDGYGTHHSDYRGVSGQDGQLALRPCDLSSESWTSTEVEPGTVCVDPSEGRVLFSSGNSDTVFTELGEVITHWGDPTSGCDNGAGLVAMSQRESEASSILVDISDPDAPVELGGVDAGWSYGCAFDGDQLYVANRQGVSLVDASDPTAPVLRSTIQPTSGYAVSVVVTAEGLLLGQEGALHLVDTTDIDNPITLESWYAPAEFAAEWLAAIDDEWAYATDDETLVVYERGEDLTELARISLELEASGAWLNGMVRVGDFLYVPASSDGLLVLDVASQTVIQRERDIEPADIETAADYVHAIALDDSGTIWTSGNDALLDTEDPRRHFVERYRRYEVLADGTVSETSRWETEAEYSTPWTILPQDDDTLLLVDGEYGLRSVALASDGTWQTQGGIPSAGLTNDVAWDVNGTVYTAEYLGGGMHLMDLDGTPADADYIHRGTSAWGTGSDRSGHVYVGGRIEGTEYDNTTFNSQSGQVGIDVYAEGEYVTNIGGACMYDIDDHGELLVGGYYIWSMDNWPPEAVATHHIRASRDHTMLQGRFLVFGPSGYTAHSNMFSDGVEHHVVYVMDMTIPTAPMTVHLSAVDDDSAQYGSVSSAGDYLLFARRDRLEIWDASDPWEPTLAYTHTDEDLGQGAEFAEVRGDYLYLHSWDGTESVYDISGGLDSPTLVDTVDTDTFGYRSRLNGNVWAQTSYWGVTFFEVPRSDERPDSVTVKYYPDVNLVDSDADGTPDVNDACPDDYTNDSDGDGSCDSDDVCPADPDDDADGDGTCADEDPCPNDPDDDVDADGICGDLDLCPADPANDADGDGVCAASDICEGGDDTADSDGDATPDACDACPYDEANDADGDGLCADEDSCPLDNPDDSDGDGSCDSDDFCPNDDEDDADGDGLCADVDPCPYDDVNDADGDGVCESDDNCPVYSNANQVDTDGDGTGDLCETDTDGDAIADDSDNCLYDDNADQADADSDGIGDACDDDSDNDGVSDASDACDGTEAGDVVDSDGCSVAQLCPCAHDSGEDKWKNHGAYTSCVAQAGGDFEDAGLISSEEKSDLSSDAGSSCCGHKKVDDECEDSDGDGWVYSEDCDDTDATAYPGASELCDGIDNDCDGDTDEDGAADASLWYADTDGDGYGAASLAQASCSQPSGYVADASDCDDGRLSSYPDAVEYCDGLDSDCDGETDEDDASDASTWYADNDGDGYGDASTTTVACYQPDAYSADATDCDDADATTNPGADETCDGADDDCDGEIDEDDATDATTWYADADADGYGYDATAVTQCEQPEGHATQGGDCDDAVAATYPGADEYCDAIDNDCDGVTDEDDAIDASTWYADVDGDGYGDASTNSVGCEAPSAYVADSSDCDDADSLANPGADEACDSIDNDCDGATDEDDAIDAGTWYADADGDGYGDPLVPSTACTMPSGYVSDDSDCDDQDPDMHPATEEICGDGVVNVCPDDASEALASCMPGDVNIETEADAIITGTTRTYGGAGAVSSAGDVNGDGSDDFMIGAYGHGTTHIFLGPVSGSLLMTEADATITGGSGDNLGTSVAPLGDINADGYEDIILGGYQGYTTANEAGCAMVFYGPLSGALDTTSADATLLGEIAWDRAGNSVGSGGDVNGDGYTDFIIGAPYRDTGDGVTQAGAAYIVMGPVEGELSLGSADLILTGENASDYAGIAVDVAGDFDGDGYDDVLIGAYTHVTDVNGVGTVYVMLGDENLSQGERSLADADFELWSSYRTRAGSSVAGAGDVNADGYDDVLVGSTLDDVGGQNSGAAYLVYGPITDDYSLEGAGLELWGDGADCRTGSDVDTAGDVNADGHDDILIGARIGEPEDDNMAYLVLGPVEGSMNLADAEVRFEGNTDWDNRYAKGGIVAGAGDVDADGYDDILIGIPDDAVSGDHYGSTYLFLAGSWF